MDDKQSAITSASPGTPPEMSALEAELPHLTKKICAHWGTPQFESLVQVILLDSRDGERKGLPWTAAQDLLFLSELSVAKRAIVAAEITGMPYSQVFKRMMANLDEAQAKPNQSWNNPGLHSDARSAKPGAAGSVAEQHTLSMERRPAQRSARPRKKSFWQKLFG